MQLRDYQELAFKNIWGQWDQGISNTLLVLPTGTGKTIVFSKVIEEAVRRGGRCLVLAHRGELLDQAADKLKQATGLGCAVEKAEETSIGSWFPVVVGSVQTLMREKRLNMFSPAHFDYIIVDEAHHSVSDSYLTVLKHFNKAKVLGVTATPDRADEKSMGELYQSMAYEYSLPEAIKEGYLSPISVLTLPVNIDLTSVSQSVGDFNVTDVETALDPYLHEIADEIKKHASDRKIVVFLPLIATSQKFQRILNQKGFRAGEVNGESKDREQVLKDFDDGHYNVLCNSMLLTEGWDCPSVDCVIVLRPTRVRSLYSQMIGRGTRLYPGKDNLLVLDFLWHTDRLDLCHPANLLVKDDEVAAKMTEIIGGSYAEGILTDLMAIEEEAFNDVQVEREERLADEIALKRKRRSRLVNPVEWEMTIGSQDMSGHVPDVVDSTPITMEQEDRLEFFGINSNSIQTEGEANRLIDIAEQRQNNKMASVKQVNMLKRYGFLNPGSWTAEQARKMSARLASAGWRLPGGVDPKTFIPK